MMGILEMDYLEELAIERNRLFGRLLIVGLVLQIFMMLFYFQMGIILAGKILFSGIVIFTPLSYFFEYKKYRSISRMATVIGYNYVVLGCCLILHDNGGVEYYFSALAVLPMVLFDIGDFKKIIPCMLLPLLSWFIERGMTYSGIIVSNSIDPSIYGLIQAVNFLGSFLGTLIFLGRFIQSTLLMRDQGVAAANAMLKELSETKNQMENFFSVSTDIIAVFSEKGLLTNYNPAFEKLTGVKREDVKKKTFKDFVHENDYGQYVAAFLKLQTGTRIMEFDCRVLAATGSYHLISWAGVFESGVFYAGGRDITKSKRTEVDLRQTMRAIDQSALVVMTNTKGKILAANSAFCEVCEYNEAELISQQNDIFATDSNIVDYFPAIREAVDQGKIWSGEIKSKTKSGKNYWIQANFAGLQNENNEIDRFIAICIDVTGNKNTQIQLVQSSKMSSLGEMAGGIAHEINSPLSIIIGKISFLRTLLENGKLEFTQLRPEFELIKDTAFRIAKIIRGLLSFSRDSAQDALVPTHVNQILEDCLALCQEQFEYRGVKIMIEEKFEGCIDCRSSQIAQIILNLMHNSLDAVESLPEKWVKISTLERDANQVEIRVTDSGKGIKSEIQAKMMQPFFTTKDIGKGTGLGLSVSSGLAQSNQGQLYYDPQAGHTSFVIKLPMNSKERKTLQAA
jgi:PAS domain S-box-containing protein